MILALLFSTLSAIPDAIMFTNTELVLGSSVDSIERSLARLRRNISSILLGETASIFRI